MNKKYKIVNKARKASHKTLYNKFLLKSIKILKASIL